MTVRYVRGALTAALVACGALIGMPPTAHAQVPLPEEGGLITLVGCIQLDAKHVAKFMLARPTIGSVASVPDGSCSAPVDEHAVELKDADDVHLDAAMVGRVVEVTGKLKKDKGDGDMDDLRKLKLSSFRPVPVVVPAPVAIEQPTYTPPPASAPIPSVPPIPAESPVATTGTITLAELPKTASQLPLIGSLSLLSLMGAFTLYLIGRRRTE